MTSVLALLVRYAATSTGATATQGVTTRSLASLASVARSKLVLRGDLNTGCIKRSYSSAPTPPSPDSILISDRAVKQMKKVCDDGNRLRITVEGGGCSGFQYLFTLEPPDAPSEDDIYISYKGVGVLVDTESLDYIRGSTLDYNTELISLSSQTAVMVRGCLWHAVIVSPLPHNNSR